MRRKFQRLNTVKILWQEEHGATIVEFAIVLPLLLLLIFGSIEFGIMIYNKQVITNASREGARFAIVQPSNPPLHTTAAVQNVVATYCTSNPLISFGTNSPPTTVIKDVASGAVINSAANVCASATNFKDIEIQVSYVYHFLVYHSIVKLINSTHSSTNAISTVTIMRCEEPF
jgi:Flp pilus assembly protein TadG